ncbi:amidohydrolase [Roseovarius sp. SCSIO 43702]|uniref:amidohydrolase n=1 Tax=Roseovarius sp. SCSIO 43702 TaxID=2823043 RepID=UPI001C732173|nr:amidohydrolase [Roseovarius sp. SCSIO 43702]QYX55979.1 amidohydrolase [Roseovarius sp. SCSIO 43702]
MQSERVDTIVVDAKIATMRREGEFAEAMALSRGRIVATGATADIRAFAPDADVIACGGRTVIPGLIDSHCHPDMHGARLGRWIDLGELRPDREGLLSLIRRDLRGKPAREWFVGFGFDDTRMGGYPTLAELDAAAGDNPVFIYRRDAHLGLVNSAAMAAVGYTDDSPDPPFGKLDRDPATGRLTGLLRETAAHEVVNHIQDGYTPEQFASGLIQVFDRFAGFGITSVHNSLASTNGIKAYQMMREAGDLRLRVGLLASGREDELIRSIIRAGWRTGMGDEWIRLTGVEWCPDCSTSGRTAAYYTPYVGQRVLGEPENNCGMLLYEQGDFNERVTQAHGAGLLVGADGVGDRGIDFVLDGFQAALDAHPRDDHRMRVEHCCNVTPPILDRLKRMGVICSSATGFAYDLGDAYIANRGAEAMRHMWPHRDMIDAGVIAPGHSDAPVCHPNPMRGIHSMVNRVTSSGASLDASQAVSVHEALEAYTTLGAFAGREEHLKGRLVPGMLGDFAILDTDIFTCPPERIHEIGVVATYVAGEAVFGGI